MQPTSRPRRRLVRATGGILLALGLFWAGTHDEVLFSFLTNLSHKLFQALGFSQQVAALQQGVSGQVTTRSLPVMLFYSLLYTGACLVLLFLALYDARRFRLALTLYGAVFGTCLVLLSGGKLLGDVAWAYRLARRLIDFIVSPLPVIMLVPLLRWYLPAPRTASTLPKPVDGPPLQRTAQSAYQA